MATKVSMGNPAGLLAASVLGLLGLTSTGCQVDIAGQTLPSPYYMHDDVQYFPAGPEFKLSAEAAEMKAYQNEADDAGDGR